MKKALAVATTMLLGSTLALALNPQPLPPGIKKVQNAKVALNPQPLPPGAKTQTTKLPAVQAGKHSTNK
jgi:hypothetical protein